MCTFSQEQGSAGSPRFMMFRTILAGASFMRDATEQAAHLCPDMRVLSPLEAGALARLALGGNNNFIGTYIADTVPRRSYSASTVVAAFSIRNDGWNTLLSSCIQLLVNVGSSSTTRLPFHEDIGPGQAVDVMGSIQMPSFHGPATLQYGIVSLCGDKIQSMPYRTNIMLV